MTIIIFIILIILISELGSILIYGPPISKQVADEYMNLNKNNLHLNSYNKNILMLDYDIFSTIFITTTLLTISSKYRINNVGLVLRGSKLHKRIEEYYIIAAKNSI